jgi:hypothetical protein
MMKVNNAIFQATPYIASIDMKYWWLKKNHVPCPFLCGGKLSKDSDYHIFWSISDYMINKW